MDVGFLHLPVQLWIFPILIVVVFVRLLGVVGWIADDDEHGRLLLRFDPARVIGREHRHLPRICHIERVHQTDFIVGAILLRCDIKLVLNVHAGDIVGQK